MTLKKVYLSMYCWTNLASLDLFQPFNIYYINLRSSKKRIRFVVAKNCIAIFLCIYVF